MNNYAGRTSTSEMFHASSIHARAPAGQPCSYGGVPVSTAGLTGKHQCICYGCSKSNSSGKDPAHNIPQQLTKDAAAQQAPQGGQCNPCDGPADLWLPHKLQEGRQKLQRLDN
jgi:hypothetical protein